MQIRLDKEKPSKSFMTHKLSNHETIHGISRWFYSGYCSFSGFLHLLPDFYILGAQKSGTTALFDYLTRHPNIPLTIKDIRFFDKYYDKGLDWYRLHFPLKILKFTSQKINTKQFMIGEATERYLEYPHAPKRIKKITPNAKFLIILRNPIERTYSHYNFNVMRNKENRSFEDAIFHEFERIKNEFKKMQMDENYYSDEYFRYAYLDRSIYVEKLKKWLEIFPRDQFFIIENEELSQNTSKVYVEVLKFLNLPKFELNEYKKIFTSKYKQPKIEQKVRDKLIEFFNPYNEELYKILGVNYDWF